MAEDASAFVANQIAAVCSAALAWADECDGWADNTAAEVRRAVAFVDAACRSCAIDFASVAAATIFPAERLHLPEAAETAQAEEAPEQRDREGEPIR